MPRDSLQDVMNKIVQRIDDIRPADLSSYEASVSELDAYMGIDPLLADLNRQYTEARYNRDKLVQEFGADDPMTEIAGDIMDSALCARETRLIELKERQENECIVKAMMEREQEEYEIRRAKEKSKDALNMYQRAQLWMNATEKKSDGILEWFFLYMIFCGRPMLQAYAPVMQRSFNARAS